MNKQLNFEELESKTSPEFVAKIKKVLVNYNGKEMPIKAVKVKELQFDEAKINNVKVMLIIGADCHIFYYDKITGRQSHEIMLTAHVIEFAEMFNEYSKSLGV